MRRDRITVAAWTGAVILCIALWTLFIIALIEVAEQGL